MTRPGIEAYSPGALMDFESVCQWYESRVSGDIQRKEWRPLLYLGVVVIEKGAFGSLLTTVG